MRSEAVRALGADDAATLIQVAKTDRDIGVRRLALERIDEADVLADLAAAESERSLRDFAGERAAQIWQSTACGDDADDAATALTGIIKLGDQHALVEVVANASLPAVRKRAFGELRDPRALAELAKSDAAQELRTGAVSRIDDGDVLRALAIDTTQKEVGLAAVDKLDDIDRLEHVAQKAKNKAVRQRARKIVGEIQAQEAERNKKPGLPDDVKRRRAEKAQLVREVEGMADSFDFEKVGEKIKAAQASWAALGTAADDGDDRFEKAVARFWRRKEIHEQTARSAHELRHVEREAAADKERAAAERAAREQAAREQAAAPPKEPTPEELEARAAREAEEKARREEKERQRAEETARREAQAAERAARAKEDAERGAAIAASLNALCDDMDQLAGKPQKDTREIDRLLAQAGKAFDQIGKAPPADRDAVAERYRAARAKLVTKAGELREAEDWARWANVPKAEALIETAKQMAAADASPDLGNRLRQLQALWKEEIGPLPQRRSKELWEQFKAASDAVYEKVRGVRAVETEKFGEVAKAKEALIAQAEALAESTDWAATAEQLKQLQNQWKGSGHLPRKQGDELWKRFRAACDKFFERRKPMLDQRRDEEAANLQAKHQLVARAQDIARSAPGSGGWGKAIGEIKDLQVRWKEIGWVPRRDADAVYRAFKAACDSLFQKRSEARDGEANAHRAELDAIATEIAAIRAIDPTNSADAVARTIAVRAKASELGAHGAEVIELVRHVVNSHAGALAGTDLDPTATRAAREKLIARAVELLPKEQPAAAPSVDLAAQLKQAMGRNAFGDLRWSGRDPVEVVEELRASWREAGPEIGDEDRAQSQRFEETVGKVLEAAGATAKAAPAPAPREDEEGGGRRRRRDRRGAEAPSFAGGGGNAGVVPAPGAPKPSSSDEPTQTEREHALAVQATSMAGASSAAGVSSASTSASASSSTPAAQSAVPVVPSAPDAVTRPVSFPPPTAPTAPDVPSPTPAPASRASNRTLPPPPVGLDTGWDLGDDDPTADANEKPGASTPSSSEMAGDGAVEGDGIDTGWD